MNTTFSTHLRAIVRDEVTPREWANSTFGNTAGSIGRGTGLVILKRTADQIIQRMFERLGQQLSSIGQGNRLGLLRVVVPVSYHRRFASISALLRA
ncbi:MAG: hypothetical protein ABIO49_04300 [Dokdonella sp.]